MLRVRKEVFFCHKKQRFGGFSWKQNVLCRGDGIRYLFENFIFVIKNFVLDPDGSDRIRVQKQHISGSGYSDSKYPEKKAMSFSVQKGRRRRRSCDVSCPTRMSPYRRSTWPTYAIMRRQRQRVADTYRYRFDLFYTMLRIHAILVRIRNPYARINASWILIRILLFSSLNFKMPYFSAYFFLKVRLHHFSKVVKKSKRSHKTVGIKVLLTIFGWWNLKKLVFVLLCHFVDPIVFD